MTNYCQKDPRWRDTLLGFSLTDKIGNDGCVVTSLGIMSDIPPDAVNARLKAAGGFLGASVKWLRAAQALGLKYDSDTTSQKYDIAIAETDHYKPNYPSHYFVVLADNTIIDPLDGVHKANPYKIIAWRNLSPREETVTLAQELHIKWDGAYEMGLVREPENSQVVDDRVSQVIKLINSGKSKPEAQREVYNTFVKSQEWQDKNKGILA